jgi:hypothetical protein
MNIARFQEALPQVEVSFQNIRVLPIKELTASETHVIINTRSRLLV